MAENQQSQAGFTLIEVAITLLIITILLGYTVALLPVQQDLKRSRQAESELSQIINELVGFAQVNGRLPCPDIDQDGEEDVDADPTIGCDGFFGFLPGRTLGINGKYSNAGLLLDPWGTGYGYAVSDTDFADGNIDLVTANGIRSEGLSNVVADLFVCDGSAALGNDLDCTAAASNEVVGNVAAVVISLGKDKGNVASNVQAENTDDFNDGTNDKVYVFATRSEAAGAEFDDVVKWLSTNQLFSKMIEADQLP